MTQEQLDALGLETSLNFNSEMFVLNIPCYKVKDKNIWVSQYDFRTGRDLRPKDLYCVYGYKRENGKKIQTVTHFSQFLLDEGYEGYIRNQIDTLFDNLKA